MENNEDIAGLDEEEGEVTGREAEIADIISACLRRSFKAKCFSSLRFCLNTSSLNLIAKRKVGRRRKTERKKMKEREERGKKRERKRREGKGIEKVKKGKEQKMSVWSI